MNLKFASTRMVRLALAALWLLAGQGAVLGASFALQGQSKGNTNWISGNLQNWQELDYIPCRVLINSGGVSNQVITITFPHLTGTTPGFENLVGFTTSPNVSIVSGPILSAPAGADWSYSLTINYSDAGPGYLMFFARLAAGSHLNVGSSLMIGGSPQGMGQLQIHKPAPGPGRPDLAIVKSGPATAAVGGIITYTLSYTNKATGTNTAFGTQISDILPSKVIVDTNTLVGAQMTGNTIFWDLGNVAPGANGIISFQAQVDPTISVNSYLTNFAQILSSEDDNNYTDNSSTVITFVNVPLNRAPTANNDAYSVNEDAVLTVAAPGVLANDTDADANPLTAVLASNPSHGTLSFNTNGSFVYTPVANYYGPDSFTYRANDGLTNSSDATVSITVVPVNDAPVAANDSYTTPEDTTLNISAPGVLANDSDIDGDSLTSVLASGPAHGNLVFNSNGSFTYTPTNNYNGPDSFTYRANDGLANSAVATVSITIGPVNNAPVAANDSYTTPEDTTLNISAPGILANDSDIESDPLAAVLVSGTVHGTLSLNANGSFTYTPTNNYNGPDSFTYHANDGTANSGDATVSITVTPVNDVPVAANDSYTTPEDTTLNISVPGVLANDSDVEGGVLTAVLATGPLHGNLSLNADGSFSYTPTNNYNGPDSFTYHANDGTANSGDATVSITVTPVNDAPAAANDSYTTPEDTTLNITAPGVLANDSDVEADPLTAALVSGPVHGSLSFNADGSFSYTPTNNYTGPDSFTYRANDGTADSGVATVSITVTPVNDAPEAVNDSYTTPEDTTLNITAPGVLANDSDVEGDTLTAALASGPLHGNLTLNADGSFSYTPTNNYTGPDSFTYRANDGTIDSSIATVSITVTPVNDAPVAADDSYTTPEDTTLNISAPGVLANDSDVEGDALTSALVTGPVHGTLTLNANGSFSYTPTNNYNGPDSFIYRANDGTANSADATVSITVTPVNDAPVAANDSYTTPEDTTLNISAPGVLANDTDADGNSLTAALVSGPIHGTLALNANGSFSYTPTNNYNGPDSFTYRANDGTIDSSIATVSITVTPVNDAPVAADDSYTTPEDTTLNISVPGVLANDSDVDGDALTATLVTGPAHGNLVLNANGSFAYTPTNNYTGPDSFTYRANDGTATSGVATVSITVTPVNDAPVAANDSYTTPEDTTLNISAPGVLANDTDPEGNALTAALVTGPAHGTLNLNANGSFSYTPTNNYNGPDSFTYRANDGVSNSAIATVSITVTPVNDAPVAANDSYTTPEDTTLNISAPGVLNNDTDADGSGLTAALVTGPLHGTVNLNVNGSFSYTPTNNYNGPDSFTYRASDGTTNSGDATVSITVTPVNDAPVADNNSYTAFEDTTLNVSAAGVLANDTDIDGDTLTAVLVNGPLHGSLSLNANGGFSYTPTNNYNGPDSFTYRANDGAANSAIATVSITVLPVNDPPSFTKGADQFIQKNAGAQTVVAWATNISPGPADEAGQIVTFILSNDNNGLFTVQPAIASNGTLTYTPAANVTGSATVTVVARDNGGTANGGVDTSAPQTFHITINSPPTVTLISPTNNAVFIAPANFAVAADAQDADGFVTNVEFFEGTNKFGETSIGNPYVLMRTNVGPGTYTFTAKATDNDGATGVSAPVTITVVASPPLTVLSAVHFNPQTGLYEETVRVSNPGTVPFDGVRIYIPGLPGTVHVYNASGTTNGVPYVQSNFPVAPGGYVDFVIEYHVTSGGMVPNPTLVAEVLWGAGGSAASVSGIGVHINRGWMRPDKTFLVEFMSATNRIYYVQYSSDLQNWKTAQPAIAGSGTWIQWIDNGLPKTESAPSETDKRFYRVIVLP